MSYNGLVISFRPTDRPCRALWFRYPRLSQIGYAEAWLVSFIALMGGDGCPGIFRKERVTGSGSLWWAYVTDGRQDLSKTPERQGLGRFDSIVCR